MTALRPAVEPRPARSVGVPALIHPTFDEIYDQHFAFVWRSARRLGVFEAHLDDAVQEIFLVVHRRLGEFEGRSSMRTWLFGIVRNIVRAHRRSLRSKSPPAPAGEDTADVDRIADAGAGPQERALRAEAARLVERLLESLDDDRREVFVLAELERMSAPEIASSLGLPLNTVYSRLRLARQEFAAAAARYRAKDEWRTR